MNEIRHVGYKGHTIVVYAIQQRRVYVGGTGEFTTFLVLVDEEDVTHLVQAIGAGPDEMVENARLLIDAEQDAGG